MQTTADGDGSVAGSSGAVSMRARVCELAYRKRAALAGPGPVATQRQHDRGKWTVRERIDALLDRRSFTEIEGLRTVPPSGTERATDSVRWLRQERRRAFVPPHSWSA